MAPAIDICPQAAQIMRERGIKDARQQDFFQFESEKFDTIFMLELNIGICETLNSHADNCGWTVKKLISTEEEGFLA